MNLDAEPATITYTAEYSKMTVARTRRLTREATNQLRLRHTFQKSMDNGKRKRNRGVCREVTVRSLDVIINSPKATVRQRITACHTKCRTAH